MNAKSVAERQRALREARAASGLTEVRGIYAHPEDHEAIKTYAAKLAKKRSAYAGIRSAWVRACERAGIEDLNIHDLRGRAGVDAMGEEQDIRKAQKLLGHKSEAMSRHYTEGKYHKKVKPSK